MQLITQFLATKDEEHNQRRTVYQARLAKSKLEQELSQKTSKLERGRSSNPKLGAINKEL